MAELELNNNNKAVDEVIEQNGEIQQEPVIQPSDELEPVFTTESKTTKMLHPNEIDVTIADKDAPLIVLFGPPSSGKTMTMIRLTRYLKKNEYTVAAVKSFRDSFDERYHELCEKFNQMVSSTDAAESTPDVDFMLIEVIDKSGRRLCQILEAPGEHYYNPNDPGGQFPAFVNKIINAPNRKIYCIMVEPDWKSSQLRKLYVDKISQLRSRLRSKDRILFLYNKIDKTNLVRRPGVVNTTQAKKDVMNFYPGMIEQFENDIPFMKFFKPYLCDFLPFQTGDFTKANSKLTYQEGPDEYPRDLWRRILKYIRG